ncbi:type II toxin-antitoxin system Y4mF family antitoxin [Arthrobacter sp. H5]|uniref:type II toxin-antitoxin system Y4mF family antitoxin n=1 Tax=Arthrobacter sp. H5 TaxID=1267973 RepID=UPI0004B35925|nr:type II toxin-antitoxin system Y4mF family antitoxin [Arthrobacter sp. H5]
MAFEQALAESVRARRVAEHLTQADLADLSGVSERFVRSVERGKSTIRLESLLAVLRTLGLDLAVTGRHRESDVPAVTEMSGLKKR